MLSSKVGASMPTLIGKMLICIVSRLELGTATEYTVDKLTDDSEDELLCSMDLHLN